MFEINYIGLIISMVLLAAFMTPIYLNVRKNNKKKRALDHEIKFIALENGLKLQYIDSWRNVYTIGMDPEVKKLVYISDKPAHKAIILDLSQLQSVGIHTKDHVVGSGKNTSKVTDLLELQLHFYNGNQSTTTLQFYDGDLHSDLQDEYPLIQKWQQLLLPMVKVPVQPSLYQKQTY
jgi:hypothetical protein